MEEFSNSGNINDKWLLNVYENIKRLEEFERMIREGCSSILDFLQIPLHKRAVVIGSAQYKNLRFFITEFRLLMADLTPILDKDRVAVFEKTISHIEKALDSDRLFVKSIYDLNHNVIETKPTPFFYETLNILHNLKIELFKDIKDILYIKSSY